MRWPGRWTPAGPGTTSWSSPGRTSRWTAGPATCRCRGWRRPAPGAARRPGGGRGLPADAGQGHLAGRPAVRRGGQRAGRDHRAAALAGRQPLHLPRLPGVRPGGRTGGDVPAGRAGHRSGHPPARPGGIEVVRHAAPRGARPGQGAGAAHHHQGELPVHRAPAVLPGLHRGQAGGRGGPGQRRVPVPRAVHARRLPREHHPHPGAPAQAGQRAGRGRAGRGQPRRAGPDRDPGGLPARGAVPDHAAGAGADRARRAGPAGTPADPAVPPPGPVRAVHVLPGLPAPGPVHHRGAAARARGAPARLRRGGRRVQRDRGRLGAGPVARRGAGRARHPATRGEYRRAGSQAGRRGAVLGRGPGRGRARAAGRGGGQDTARYLLVSHPGDVQGRRARGVRAGRPDPDRPHAGVRRAGRVRDVGSRGVLRRGAGGGRPARPPAGLAADHLPGRFPDHADRRAAPAAAHGRRGGGRAPVRVQRPGAGHAVLGL